MAIQRKSRVIDGRTFEVEQLGAMAGVKMLRRLTAIAGPVLAKMASGKSLTQLVEQDLGDLAGAIEALFDRLSEAELEAIVKKLLEGATMDGKSMLATMELELAGQTLTIFKVVAFAIEVNYGDFPDALAALATKAKPVAVGAKASPSQTSTTSSGPSNA